MAMIEPISARDPFSATDLIASRCKELASRRAKRPRVTLRHLPTPLEPMDRFGENLGGPCIWVKRDDCTGLSFGGNKTRNLEYLMADVQAKGADVVITRGAAQSNHAYQTAAASGTPGKVCQILLKERGGGKYSNYTKVGTVLLDRVPGSTVTRPPAKKDMNAEMQLLPSSLTADVKTPYVIPDGGYEVPTGSMKTAVNLLAQTEERLFDPVYSGEGLAGMNDQIEKGYFGAMNNVVFLPTGGSAALFGCRDAIELPDKI